MNNSKHREPANYVVTSQTFNGGESFSFDGITQFDFESVDSQADRLRELLESGKSLNDIAIKVINDAKREVMAEVLLKLLLLLSDSKDLKADIELLISASGLGIRTESDSKIAERLGISRQVFSARKQVLLKKLGLTPPAHSKSETACNEYKLTNPTKYGLN